VRFHAFVQWRIDQQLQAASREIAIVHDLPIGLDVAGADAWAWQDFLADGSPWARRPTSSTAAARTGG